MYLIFIDQNSLQSLLLFFAIFHEMVSDCAKLTLVMEYIAGHTLETIMHRTTGFLAEVYVHNWALQICDALDYLHNHKPPIIFRDLKPANIMLTYDGVIKLIDFGIARLFNPAKGKDTVVMGTPGYAPLEQYGSGQTDARTDIYALGATLHQLLTRYDPASNPFHFPDCEQMNPAVSPQMTATIKKALASKPTDRYPTVKEMQQAMATIMPSNSTASTKATGVVPLDIVSSSDDLIVYKAFCKFAQKEALYTCYSYR